MYIYERKNHNFKYQSCHIPKPFNYIVLRGELYAM